MTSWTDALPRRVTIIEVGPRDGLQNLSQFVPTRRKIDLVNALSRAGLTRIEATAFVHPKAVPQHQDAEAVVQGIERAPSVRYSALVANLVGARRAVASRVDELVLVVSASESHNRSNVRRSIGESLDGFIAIAELARDADVALRGSVATSFGCPFEGRVPPERVAMIVGRYRDIGISETGLCDTTGMADPVQVVTLLDQIRSAVPGMSLSVHFHNTRGAGLANVLAALQAGVTLFEASLGGLGGCPFAPGATGNVCTEDLVHMFERMGVRTGVNLEALIRVSQQAQAVLGRELPGQVMKAGPADRLYSLEEFVPEFQGQRGASSS